VVVVEKREEISILSRSLVISTRSMEILRAWGLEDEVRAGAADVEPCGWATCTLASGEGTVIPLGHPSAAEAASVSPTRPAWAPQDHLEPLLLAYLRSFPRVEIQFGAELARLDQDDDGVRALLRDRESVEPHAIAARFVIGADGAHSTVRNQLGIRMDGHDNLGDYERVEFRAPLAEIAGEHRYGLNMILHPDARGALTPQGPNDRWGLSRERRSGQTPLADYREGQLADLIRTAAGVPSLQPHIERVSTFSFAAQIAERYREGGTFLIGDAAHRMTPRGGTGMNTAIHDAYDLGWKLGWVLQVWAEEDLLSSYETERRPVGLHNVNRSGDPNGARQELSEALLWDLNGRLAHGWLRRGSDIISTLDLLTDGLTLLANSAEPRVAHTASALNSRAPVTTHSIDEPTANLLGIQPGGAILLRPDGRPLLRWPSFTAPLLPGPLPLPSHLRGLAVMSDHPG
jgi:putative polyketide hydroxylase